MKTFESQYAVILIVLDGVGIGELPDAAKYNDQGSNTLVNTAKAVGVLNLPNLQKLGLGNITSIQGVPPEPYAQGNWGKAAEISAGKDSTTGHWEMMGIISNKPFPTYPKGFPNEVINRFIEKTGCQGVLGNKPASGTAIINELGEEHLKTKYPIVYTSADSVFQIATHEDIYPVKELYRLCEIARNSVLIGKHRVARVIARPFVGDKNGNFVRTPRRKDFSVPPPEKSVLDFLKEADYQVIGIGKIEDLFNYQGLTYSLHTQTNEDALNIIEKFIDRLDHGLIFANLSDFDTLWGHRNNAKAFAEGLQSFDTWLGTALSKLSENKIIIVTADHGNDPTTPSTDHSREYIPIIVYSPSLKSGVNIGIRKTFADIGATLSEIFNITRPKVGESFWNLIK